jgi:hypothetical protein
VSVDLAAIRAQLRRLTPYPWTFSNATDVRGSKGEFRAPSPHNGFALIGPWCNYYDVEFMTEAPQIVEALLAEVERLTTTPPQRKPVCDVCGDSIIYVPKSGFGNTGEWRHLAPPRIGVPDHPPAVKVFVDPPLIVNAGNESHGVPDE